MSHESAHGTLRRRALAFSALGIVMCVVLLAIFESVQMRAPDQYTTMELLARAESLGRAFSWREAPALVVFGVAAGIFAGMLGMGGGVLKVAGMLILLKLDILLARAVSLSTMFIASVTSAWVHHQSGAVMWEVVRPMLLPAVAGVIGGAILGDVLPRAVLTHFFGFFALFLALNTMAYTFADPHESAFADPNVTRLDSEQRVSGWSVGALHGFVCGLLGISGGVIATPLQQSLLRIPAHNAVANSVTVSAFCTGVGSTMAAVWGVTNHEFEFADLAFSTVCIGLGAVVGARFGASLTGRIRAARLKLLFVVVCIGAGLSILLQ